jgi:hypothetical protein
MKSMLAAVAAVALASPALAADVGVSVTITQPGVYGRIDLGRFPQPQVVLPQPVVIAPPVVVPGPPPQPVYMWVPYEHRKDWKHHCARYNACGVPVYFVRHDWYEREVAPHGRRGGDRRDDDRRDDDHGKGWAKGHGKGRD